jgi:tRNA(fMet)-specific endonuclease VapC
MNGDREEGDLNNSGYLLDTDILIAFLRGKNARLKKRMNELLRRDIPVYMSIISLGELYLGAFKSDNTPKNLSLVNSLKEQLALLELNDETVLLYGEIEAVLEKCGQVIGDFEVLIASTAINSDVTLVSGNERHFKRIVTLFGQLQFEKWDTS